MAAGFAGTHPTVPRCCFNREAYARHCGKAVPGRSTALHAKLLLSCFSNICFGDHRADFLGRDGYKLLVNEAFAKHTSIQRRAAFAKQVANIELGPEKLEERSKIHQFSFPENQNRCVRVCFQTLCSATRSNNPDFYSFFFRFGLEQAILGNAQLTGASENNIFLASAPEPLRAQPQQIAIRNAKNRPARDSAI